jgi:ankyrin repeat protein
MRSLIEKYDLDVTKPRRSNSKKDTKMAKDTNFETMLHVAAGSCDAALVDWLLDRGKVYSICIFRPPLTGHLGADPSALDPSHLTPFHVAISRGNTPVARHLISLYRNTKNSDPRYQLFCDGCHPSKAAKDKDGTTPLQLAIRSDNLDMVELLLKDATVHNVEKCWAQLQQEEQRGEIGDMLLTKVD